MMKIIFCNNNTIKIFSRAVQLSYILLGNEQSQSQSTRSIFNRTVAVYTPAQPDGEISKVIKSILDLFLVDDYKLNPKTFYEFSNIYKLTHKNDWKTRVKISLHAEIIKILNEIHFSLPSQDLMGGKKIN